MKNSLRLLRLLVFSAAYVAAASGGRAWADPVAIVEEAKGRGLAIDFMDYVEAGRVIDLGRDGELVLGYLRSCWRESIKGGKVTIGLEQSEIVGGEVQRRKVECDGGRLRLTAAQSTQAGVMVFRTPPRSSPSAAAAQVTLYGLSPVLVLRGGGNIVIQRIDQPAEPIALNLDIRQDGRDSHQDLAVLNHQLTAGGVYRASAGSGREIVFTIDPTAKPGALPLLSRLLRL